MDDWLKPALDYIPQWLDYQMPRFRPAFEGVTGVNFPSWPIVNLGLSFLAGFLLLDLMRYLVHRCEHAVPFFWRFHALHHSDPDVDVTTSVRHHPIEYVLASGVY